MKRLFLIFILLLTGIFFTGLKIQAKDIVPVTPNISSVRTVGLYQVGNDITIYKEPDENSMILYRVRWDKNDFFPQEIGENNFFTIFMPNKDLALVSATDITEDWVEIVYDNSTGATGWIKKDDPYKFMTWINFYNAYGKKYGLKLLKGAPETCKDMKASPEDEAKTISVINVPHQIKLVVVRGNWALVSVYDLDKTPKTGYIRYRSDSGVRYYFPAVK